MHLPHLAALRDEPDVYDPYPTAPADPSFELAPGLLGDALWGAALGAGADSASPGHLSIAWDDFVRGRLAFCCESTGHQRAYVIARLGTAPPERGYGLDLCEGTLLARLLCGEPQKALAFELRMASSTVSGHLIRALVKLGLSGAAVPLPIVLAAQASQLGLRIPDTRSAPFEHQGCVYRVLSVPRPKAMHVSCLTPAEREIAELLLDGLSRSEIAYRRVASVNTVARQISSIFSALEVTGRYALIRAAVDLGCFD